MREVCVIGVGMNKWGELWDKSIRDLFVNTKIYIFNGNFGPQSGHYQQKPRLARGLV